MIITFKKVTNLAAALMALVSLCLLGVTTQAQATENIVELASGNDNLSTLVTAVTAADLVSTLEGPGPFTILAPQDSAFENLPEGLLEALLLPENKDSLIKILTYHAIPSELDSTAVTDAVGTDVATVQGATVAISQDGTDLVINGNAKVVTADVEASNGIVHIIDNVLVPADLDVTGILASSNLPRTGGRDSAATTLWNNNTLVFALGIIAIISGISVLRKQ